MKEKLDNMETIVVNVISEDIPEYKNNNIEEEPKKVAKKSKLKIFFIIMMILFFTGAGTAGFLLYGPYDGFRDWYITSAMTTMNHQYLATWFYSDEQIAEVLNRNKVIEIEETTNPDLIEEVIEEEIEEIIYENEYERAVLERDSENEDYKIIEISGKGYSGYLAVIYDPSRVKTVVSSRLGSSGEYLTKMAKDNKALVAINGGGFDDEGYQGNGSTPSGVTIRNGVAVAKKKYGGNGGVVGFNQDDVLVLGKMTYKEALNMGIRDAVSFGPFLIVNGKPAEIVGNGGWGTAPRTAIGQRKDGIVLFLCIDGRRATKPGASIKDLIEIMQNYGAYNASNLDGGTSSAMAVNGELINDPVDSSGNHRTRHIASAFILTSPEEEENL